MSISAVGNGFSNGGTGLSTLAVSPTSTGDILALGITSQFAHGSVSAITGGGVSSWNAGSTYFDSDTDTYVDNWWGVITSTGSATITATGIGASTFTVLWAQQFTSSDSGVWTQVAANPAAGSSGPALGSGTNVSWPAFSVSSSPDLLYLGNGISVFGTLSAGSTPGYTYPSTGFSSNRPVYNPAYSGSGGPTSTQTNTGAYDTVGLVLTVKSPLPSGITPCAVAMGAA